MKKYISNEFILPAFWLFFFIVAPKSEVRDNNLRKADNSEIKNQEIAVPGITNILHKYNEPTAISFTKAVYLLKY